VLCNGALPACDLDRLQLDPGTEEFCDEWLGDSLPPDVEEVALAFVAELPRDGLLEAAWEGLAIGEWVAASTFFQDRSASLDQDDPATERAVRELLVEAIRTAASLQVLFDEYRPDTLVLLDGRSLAHQAAFELARQRGIRFVTHGPGLQRCTVRLAENHRTHDLAPLHELWYRWKDVPLSKEELAHTRELLDERSRGEDDTLRFIGLSGCGKAQPASLRAYLDLDGRPLVAVFHSLGHGTSGSSESLAFLPAVLGIAREMKDLQFVLHTHPSRRSEPGTCLESLERALGGRDGVPDNVRVIMPGDEVSSNLLMGEARAGIVHASIAGLEMACTGKPVLCMAEATYSHVGCTRQLDDPRHFADELRRALATGTSEETARLALRWTYRYFSHHAQPFPIPIEEPGEGGSERLTPLEKCEGPNLDRVCLGLLGRIPILPRPGARERTRSCDAEDAWLAGWVDRAVCSG